LSFRDGGEGYLGSKGLWDKAQSIMEQIAKEEKLNYNIVPGDAAFYGPKIDFLATDALGRTHQVATIQLDFVMPERFGLIYTDEKGQNAQPVMIHCALLGSIERFLAIYLEHTSGKFPVWLAPEQLRVIALNDDAPILKLAKDVVEKAIALGIRASLDGSNESVGKKIRDAEVMKVPYITVIGNREVESEEVLARTRSDLTDVPNWKIDELLEKIADQAKSRSQ
jgi:threonyl-tRNA synthetase